MFDCDFYYFNPRGKWKYHGEGVFPKIESIEAMTHAEIASENDGMPGISGNGKHFDVVVVPRDHCEHRFAYPRMVKAVMAE